MIEYCSGCGKRHDDSFWKRTEEGWFCTEWYKPVKKTVDHYLEKFAQPFWKHAGLTPTKEELAYDKELARKGKTYLDMQRERLSKAKKTYDSTPIKEKLYKGELKQKEVKPFKKEEK